MNPFKLITKPFGCLCSLIGGIILFCILLLILGVALFNRLFPGIVEEYVEIRGGFPVRIDEANWDLLGSAFDIEDVVVENPPNFPEKDFLHIRSLTMEASPNEVLHAINKKETHIKRLELDIERFNWVLTDGGSTNLGLFAKAVEEEAEARTETKTETAAEPATSDQDNTPSGVTVQTWVIRIGTIEVSDYSRGPVQREKIVLNYEREFHDAPGAKTVIEAVAKDMASYRLEPVITRLLASIFMIPDVSKLAGKIESSTDWLEKQTDSFRNVFDEAQE
ncbi:hypothetical protein [Rubellicoccus peritrichatus]|uniref:Uncharacterized protein n=1 Tax=Rubellicoccus peritrichatus TaxID=3080537 RepID=A0AAQ3LA25_9BACT|nr:hypothetical protein [Puniceicoccus sp. CR14]WOO41457.1 hypothetical protein RZN69_00045 [Puniceicoccus sp. CR14]